MLDVTKKQQAEELFTKVKLDFGLITILVNNAGVAFKQADKTSAMATTVSYVDRCIG